MPKALCVFGLVVSGLLLLLFGLDLALGIPFGRASMLMDAGMVVTCGLMGYLGYSSFREQR